MQNEDLILVGYFPVGNGKFGEQEIGHSFEPIGGDTAYWENRGYTLVPVYVPKED